MKTRIISAIIIITVLSVFLHFNSYAYDESQELDQEKALQLFEAANLVAGSVSPNHYFTYWETVELWQENGVNEFYKPPYSYSELCKKYDAVISFDTSEYKTTDIENLHITKSELYGILRSVFSKEISNYYFENVFKIRLRDEDGGNLKFIEKDGILFDCGCFYGSQNYGYLRRPDVKSFQMIGSDKASLLIECKMYDYSHGSVDNVFDTFDYEFILEKESNGRWVFSKYIPLADYDYINKLPESEKYYLKGWLNPNTSDSAVYITASALDKSDIMEFFDKAEEISGTYYCDKNYDFGTDDKNQYTFITDGQERYYLNTKMTTVQMYSLLHEYFSDSVIDEITSYKRDGVTSRFIEHEGLVYYDLYDYPLFVGEYPQKEFKIKSVSDNKIVLSMKISRYDKTANYDYVIEKESDGEWRFTKYHYSNDIIIRLEMNNPVTSDSAVYITAAAGVIALCLAVVCKKKLKKV